LSNRFRSIIDQHTNQEVLNITDSGCIGVCKGKLLGAGYDIQCHDNSFPYDINLWVDGKNTFAKLESFSTSFQYSERWGEPNVIRYSTKYKSDDNCVRNITQRECVMAPATIDYPVLIHNNTISLDLDGLWTTDRVTTHWPESSKPNAPGLVPSKHDGLWLYLSSIFGSYALTQHEHIHNWRTEFKGAVALRYCVKKGAPGGCSMTFRDPTFDIMSEVREIAFQTALFFETEKARQKPGHRQTIEVEQVWSQIVY
jgi:hypothetical protein